MNFHNVVMNSKYDFSSDTVNIFLFLYDKSGSMNGNTHAICLANQNFKKVFTAFEEKGSIAISKSVFSDGCQLSPFMSADHFNTSYETYGNTHLYSAIVSAATATMEYHAELIKRLNVQARITFLVFSDGEDNEGNPYSYERAQRAICQLNSLDATTVFVAFDSAISARDGEKLGFSCTRDIHSVDELVSCLGVELSKSCIEQSKSAYALKSNFFSQANQATGSDGQQSTESNQDAELDAILGDWMIGS